MEDIYSFYHSILNIKNEDQKEKIKNIVKREKEKLLSKVKSLDGFCIYIASQIQDQLSKNGITTYYVDLNELVQVDHVVLISEYLYQGKIKRILIDPTFIQFVKADQKKLMKLKQWPSERLDKDIVFHLVNDGIIEIDYSIFNQYINAFNLIEQEINLDEYLLNMKVGKIK